MSINPVNLDQIRVATPCPVSWEQMTGDGRVRFCDQCQLNVYNLSELSRAEAQSLIASSEGGLCARFFRRADGTILTRDCPVGLRALRMRLSKRVAAVFALIAGLSTMIFGHQSSPKDQKSNPQTQTTTPAPDSATKGLSGTVRNQDGAAIAKAKITVTNLETGKTTTTSANEAGKFEFASLTPGHYSLKIEAPSFNSLRMLGIYVEEGKLTRVDTVLQTGEYLTGFVIQPAPVDTRTPGTTIMSGDLIRKLPIRK